MCGPSTKELVLLGEAAAGVRTRQPEQIAVPKNSDGPDVGGCGAATEIVSYTKCRLRAVSSSHCTGGTQLHNLYDVRLLHFEGHAVSKQRCGKIAGLYDTVRIPT